MGASGLGLNEAQEALLHECYTTSRIGLRIYFGTAALFLYDYCLTFHYEARFIWKRRKVSYTAVTFVLARYITMLNTMIVLAHPTPTTFSESICAILRLVGIVICEMILALRAYVLWNRSKAILAIVVGVALACAAPAAVVVGLDHSAKLIPIIPEFESVRECHVWSEVLRRQFKVVPYVVTVVFELLILSLCIVRIIQWRREIPGTERVPLIEALWRDGVLYFIWVLLLSFINVGMAVSSDLAHLRTACSQLQLTMHSILATRIVLQLADLQRERERIPTRSTVSDSTLEFAARIRRQHLTAITDASFMEAGDLSRAEAISRSENL